MVASRSDQTETTPFSLLLRKIPSAKPSGYGENGWYSAQCPAHNDKSPSLSLKENANGTVSLKCHTGCSREEILRVLELEEDDITPTGKQRRTTTADPTVDLVELAHDKLLPWQLLFNLGITDGYRHHNKLVVRIPYHQVDGSEHGKVRVRTGLTGHDSQWTGDDSPIIPYGLPQLPMATQAGYLLIGEGESDAWTCWLHGVPYLGVPGANNTHCLNGSDLKGIPQVFIVQEPDTAGKRFANAVIEQLRKTRYKGKIYAFPFKKYTGEKDPNDLHKRLVKEKQITAFKNVLLKALGQITNQIKPIEKPQLTSRLSDLMQEQLPPTKWSIPDLVPEGLTLLVGKPKLGKSWLLLTMMDAISRGGVVMGNVGVEQGEVLYISLEDNKKRLQKRARIILAKTQASESFHYATNWRRMGEGGLEDLEEWVQEHPEVRLIGIDTWARFKPHAKGNQRSLYDENYEALTPLAELASKHSISIIVVHHFRKMDSEDPIDAISGSTAMAGAVDGFLLLYRKRGEDDARLYVAGRDIEDEQELLLTFMKECATWVIKGKADDEEMASTPERQEIINLLKQHSELPARDIADKLKKNLYTIRNLLVALRNEGKIALKNNAYSLVRRSEPSYPSEHGDHSEVSLEAPQNQPEPHYEEHPTVVRPNQPKQPIHNIITMANYGSLGSLRNERGLLTKCTCGRDAIHYGAGSTPYCSHCWQTFKHQEEQ